MISVVAHRGCGFLAPENSIESIKKALELNMLYSELDIQCTSDNQIIVVHDEVINSFAVADLSYDEIVKHNPRVPLLTDVLRLVTNSHLHLFLELKPTKHIERLVDNVLSLLQKYNNTNVTILSFDLKLLQRVQKFDKTIRLCFLTERGHSFETIKPLISNICTLWAPQHAGVSDVDIRSAHSHKIDVAVWTPNSVKDLKRVAKIGADYVITDNLLLVDDLQ